MAPQSTKSGSSSQTASPKNYETLVKLVSERVWALWLEDMRRNRERGGKTLRR